MTLDELMAAARAKKAVTPIQWPPPRYFGYFSRHRRYQPAGWIVNLPGSVLHRLLPQIEIYDPKKHGASSDG